MCILNNWTSFVEFSSDKLSVNFILSFPLKNVDFWNNYFNSYAKGDM